MHLSNQKIIAPTETRLSYSIEVEWLRALLKNIYTDLSRYKMNRAEKQVAIILQNQLKSHPELFEGGRRVEDLENYLANDAKSKFTDAFKKLTEASHSNSTHGNEPRVGGDAYFATATRGVISGSEIYALTGVSTKRSSNFLLRQLRRYGFITAKGVEPKLSEFETPSAFTIYDSNGSDNITVNLGRLDKIFSGRRCREFMDATSQDIKMESKKNSKENNLFKMSMSIFGSIKNSLGLSKLLDKYARDGDYDLEVTASKNHEDLKDEDKREYYLDYMRSATRITGDIHDLAEHLGMKISEPQDRVEAMQA